jgi:hypothetical protein
MRIKIGSLVLSEGLGGSISELPSAYAVNGRRNIQLAEFFRGVTARGYNRRNTMNRIVFSITREHATHREALEWDLAHRVAADALDGSEQVTFEFQDSSGSSSTIYLWYGQLEGMSVQPIIGVSTTHTYTLVGGKLSATAPEATT